MATTQTTQSKGDGMKHESAEQRPLVKRNFIFMALSFAIIVIGFLLMLGPGNDGSEFNPDIFSTRRTVIGPTITFIGFVAMGVAIMIPGRKLKK